MNVQDYRADGYALSQAIDQAKITRAEKEVVNAYIVPLIGEQPDEEEMQQEPMRSAIMSCAFLLVSLRSAVATRAGAKTKMTAESSTPTQADILAQNAPTCARYLQDLAPLEIISRKVHDICGIYFKSQFFHTN